MAELAEIHSGFVGLLTARTPGQTPPGGLLEATNVCVRKQNEITPRPGFTLAALPAPAAAEAVGRVEYPTSDNSSGLMIESAATHWDGNGHTGTVEDEDSNPLTWESYEGAVARRALYLCTADALRAVYAPGELVAYRAGAPIPALAMAMAAAGTTTGPSYPDNTFRAYRALTRRQTYATGPIVRSAPSGRLVIFENSGPANNALRIVLHEAEDFRVGDVIELYSSETSETYPTDELYLNREISVTAAHLSAKYIEVTDDTPNEHLGADLYTNASREGAEAGNYRPPTAGCAGVYNNSLWLGDLTYPATMGIEVTYRLFGSADAGEIGLRGVSGTYTNASASVTGVSAGDIAKVAVGMLVLRKTPDTHSGTGWVRVTAVGATSFTMSETWTGATGAATIFMYDSVRIGSEYYPIHNLPAHIRGAGYMNEAEDQAAPGSSLYTAAWTSDDTGDGVPTVANAAAVPSYNRFRLEIGTVQVNTAAPQVWASQGTLYSPALPLPSEATGYQMPQDVLPDHVTWSKRDEPEHFPLTNMERVGTDGSRVCALGASRNAMLIATDAGLWRGSGYADSGVSFSELDPAVRALGRRCMAPVGAMQYVAADSGVFECDENGAESITDDRIVELDDIFESIAADRLSALKLVSNDKDDELLVCVPDTATAGDEINVLYVFNTRTRAWTRWDLPSPARDVTVKGPTRQIKATVAGASPLELTENVTLYDTSTTLIGSVTVSSVTGTTVALANGHGYDFEVGDALRGSDGVTLYLVTEVTSVDALVVHRTGLTAGSRAVRKGYTCTITPSVNTLKTPRFMKVWTTGTLLWTRRRGVYQYGLVFRSAITGANTGSTQTRVLSAATQANTDARSAPSVSPFTVSRGAARGTHLCFTITVRQAGSDWGLEELCVNARTTADKRPARLP